MASPSFLRQHGVPILSSRTLISTSDLNSRHCVLYSLNARVCVMIVGVAPPRSRARLCFLRLAVRGWLGQGQDNERFAGHGADVVMQAHHLDSGDLLDHRLHERLRRFDQMAPYLLEQVPRLLGREFGKLLFGGCQQTLEPDDDEIAEQEGANVLGASAPVFLLEAG